MAFVKNYLQDFESPNGWRYRVRVQFGILDLTTGFDEFELPEGVIQLAEVGFSYAKFPMGFSDATSVKYNINLSPLDGAFIVDLPYEEFANSLAQGFSFDGTDYKYNVFILTSDKGNDTLAVADFPIVAITAQKPTIEREFELNKQLTITSIDTICLGKLVAETYTMEQLKDDYWTEYAEASVTRTIGNLSDFYKSGTEFVIQEGVQTVAPSAYFLASAQVVLQRFLFLLVKKIWSKITQEAFSAVSSTIYTLLFTTREITPFEATTFYTTNADNDCLPTSTAVGSATLQVLTRYELRFTPFTPIGGFLHKVSSESPFRNYKNVWNFLQDLSEQGCTKAFFTYELQGTNNSNSMIVPNFEKILTGATFVYDSRDFEIMYKQGSDAIRGTKLTTNARSVDDLSEFDNSSFLSSADNEYNLKNLIFNPMPDAPVKELIIRYLDYGVKQVLYGAKLYATASDPFIRVADKVKVTFGASDSVTTSATAPTAIFPLGNPEELRNKILERQLSGGLIQGLAKALTAIFGANGAGFIEITEMFRDDLKLGDIVELTNVNAGLGSNIEGWIRTPSGAGVSFARCVVTEIIHDVVTDKMKVTAFAFQNIGDI